MTIYLQYVLIDVNEVRNKQMMLTCQITPILSCLILSYPLHSNCDRPYARQAVSVKERTLRSSLKQEEWEFGGYMLYHPSIRTTLRFYTILQVLQQN